MLTPRLNNILALLPLDVLLLLFLLLLLQLDEVLPFALGEQVLGALLVLAHSSLGLESTHGCD